MTSRGRPVSDLRGSSRSIARNGVPLDPLRLGILPLDRLDLRNKCRRGDTAGENPQAGTAPHRQTGALLG